MCSSKPGCLTGQEKISADCKPRVVALSENTNRTNLSRKRAVGLGWGDVGFVGAHQEPYVQNGLRSGLWFQGGRVLGWGWGMFGLTIYNAVVKGM